MPSASPGCPQPRRHRRVGQLPGRIHPHPDDGTGGQPAGASNRPVRGTPPAVHRAQAVAGDGANRWLVAVRSTAGT
jgi:hypothetical protein